MELTESSPGSLMVEARYIPKLRILACFALCQLTRFSSRDSQFRHGHSAQAKPGSWDQMKWCRKRGRFWISNDILRGKKSHVGKFSTFTFVASFQILECSIITKRREYIANIFTHFLPYQKWVNLPLGNFQVNPPAPEVFSMTKGYDLFQEGLLCVSLPSKDRRDWQ